MAIMSIGFGILISSLTTKYRDLSFLLTFAMQLWMYATPIVYPLSLVPENFKIFYLINPMSCVIEYFRLSFFSVGSITFSSLLLSIIISFSFFIIGIFLFSKIEKNFMDTI